MNVNSERRERRHDRLVEYTQLTARFDNMIEKMDEYRNEMDAKFDNLTKKVDYVAERIKPNVKVIEEKFDESQDIVKKVDNFRDCTSIKNQEPSASGGKYDLFLPGIGNVDAQCVMDSNGKGWTVILARDDNVRPHVNFDQSKKKTIYYIPISNLNLRVMSNII